MTEPKASDWLNRKRAASYLADHGCPISVRTLELWASNNNAGRGPPFVRVRSKIIRYLKADLQAWASREIVRVE
jgi:hypothetical protein